MSVITILPVSTEIISNAKERNRNGTGSPFPHEATEVGSKSEGFFLRCGTRSFNSAIFSCEEEVNLRILFCNSGIAGFCRVGVSGGEEESGVSRLLGFRVEVGVGSEGCGDFRLLGDEEGFEGFFLAAAARAPDIKASNAEGGLDMVVRWGKRESVKEVTLMGMGVTGRDNRTEKHDRNESIKRESRERER